jgi:hypothetical protein
MSVTVSLGSVAPAEDGALNVEIGVVSGVVTAWLEEGMFGKRLPEVGVTRLVGGFSGAKEDVPTEGVLG